MIVIGISNFEIQLGYSQIHLSLNTVEIRDDSIQLAFIEKELNQSVGKDLIDTYPVFIVGKKHRLDIVFQLALRIIMIGQETRQVFILHVTDAVCRRDVCNQFFSIYIYQSGKLTFPFQKCCSDKRLLK